MPSNRNRTDQRTSGESVRCAGSQAVQHGVGTGACPGGDGVVVVVVVVVVGGGGGGAAAAAADAGRTVVS